MAEREREREGFKNRGLEKTCGSDFLLGGGKMELLLAETLCKHEVQKKQRIILGLYSTICLHYKSNGETCEDPIEISSHKTYNGLKDEKIHLKLCDS